MTVDVVRAAQHVIAAICSEDAVPIAELLDDLKTLADGTARVPGHLTGEDVELCLRPVLDFYGSDAVLQVRSDVEEPCPDDPDGLHHVGCGC